MEAIGFSELYLFYEQDGEGLQEICCKPITQLAPLVISTSMLCSLSIIAPEVAHSLADSAMVQMGSQGEKVREIQVHLRDWGFPLNPSKRLSVDGIFGEATRSAVLEFQAHHNLQQDGIVGRTTYALLSSPPDYPSTPLKQGDVGDRVREIQSHLRNWGYPLANPTPLLLDGIFGKQTQQAVREFQSSRGLSSTGIVDSKTYAALSKAVKFENLYLGSKGSRVNAVQDYLAKWNLLFEVDLLSPNGVFDTKTQAAVMSFQKENGLPPNGIVDSRTYELLANPTFRDIYALFDAGNVDFIVRHQDMLARALKNTNDKLIAYKKFNSHPILEGRLLNALGITYLSMGAGEIEVKNTLAATFWVKQVDQDKLNLAEQYLEQARIIFSDSQNSFFEGQVLKNLGAVYVLRNQYDQARDYFIKALSSFEKFKFKSLNEQYNSWQNRQMNEERAGLLRSLGLSYYYQGLTTLSNAGFQSAILEEDCMIVSGNPDLRSALLKARDEFFESIKQLSSLSNETQLTLIGNYEYELSKEISEVASTLSCTLQNSANGSIDRNNARSDYAQTIQVLIENTKKRIDIEEAKGIGEASLAVVPELSQSSLRLNKALRQLNQEFEIYRQNNDLPRQVEIAETIKDAAAIMADVHEPRVGDPRRRSFGRTSGP